MDMMGGIIANELAAGSSPESGGLWLHVWMEIGDDWCPPEVGAGANTL